MQPTRCACLLAEWLPHADPLRDRPARCKLRDQTKRNAATPALPTHPHNTASSHPLNWRRLDNFFNDPRLTTHIHGGRRSLLALAAAAGDLEAVRALLRRGAVVDTPTLCHAGEAIAGGQAGCLQGSETALSGKGYGRAPKPCCNARPSHPLTCCLRPATPLPPNPPPHTVWSLSVEGVAQLLRAPLLLDKRERRAFQCAAASAPVLVLLRSHQEAAHEVLMCEVRSSVEGAWGSAAGR